MDEWAWAGNLLYALPEESELSHANSEDIDEFLDDLER